MQNFRVWHSVRANFRGQEITGTYAISGGMIFVHLNGSETAEQFSERPYLVAVKLLEKLAAEAEAKKP
jgi:hypothetical protein